METSIPTTTTLPAAYRLHPTLPAKSTSLAQRTGKRTRYAWSAKAVRGVDRDWFISLISDQISELFPQLNAASLTISINMNRRTAWIDGLDPEQTERVMLALGMYRC